MSLRCNCCAAVDTAEIAQKQRKACESPKSTVKRVPSLKHGLPVDTEFFGEKQGDPTETHRAGDPTERSTGWCRPPDTRPCPGTVAGEGGRARAGQVPGCPLGKRTKPFEPAASPSDAGPWQGLLTRQISLIKWCVSLVAHVCSCSPGAPIQLPRLLIVTSNRTGKPRAPSSALSCVVNAKLTPVKTKLHTE